MGSLHVYRYLEELQNWAAVCLFYVYDDCCLFCALRGSSGPPKSP